MPPGPPHAWGTWLCQPPPPQAPAPQVAVGPPRTRAVASSSRLPWDQPAVSVKLGAKGNSETRHRLNPDFPAKSGLRPPSDQAAPGWSPGRQTRVPAPGSGPQATISRVPACRLPRSPTPQPTVGRGGRPKSPGPHFQAGSWGPRRSLPEQPPVSEGAQPARPLPQGRTYGLHHCSPQPKGEGGGALGTHSWSPEPAKPGLMASGHQPVSRM